MARTMRRRRRRSKRRKWRKRRRRRRKRRRRNIMRMPSRKGRKRKAVTCDTFRLHLRSRHGSHLDRLGAVLASCARGSLEAVSGPSLGRRWMVLGVLGLSWAIVGLSWPHGVCLGAVLGRRSPSES
eukprot:9478567-Pyramimonas_sp.AAC.1